MERKLSVAPIDFPSKNTYMHKVGRGFPSEERENSGKGKTYKGCNWKIEQNCVISKSLNSLDINVLSTILCF